MLIAVWTIFSGCKSSEEDEIFNEATPQEEQTAREAALRDENTRLKNQLATLEQTNLDLKAKIADLEKKLQTQQTAAAELAAFTAKYQEALRTFATGRYREAMMIFQDLLNSGARNDLTDNCQYWIGECYYGLKDYRSALSNFERVLTYPNSDKTDDAYYMMGNCYARLGKIRDAKVAFQRVVKDYPQSEYFTKAQRKLRRL